MHGRLDYTNLCRPGYQSLPEILSSPWVSCRNIFFSPVAACTELLKLSSPRQLFLSRLWSSPALTLHSLHYWIKYIFLIVLQLESLQSPLQNRFFLLSFLSFLRNFLYIANKGIQSSLYGILWVLWCPKMECSTAGRNWRVPGSYERDGAAEDVGTCHWEAATKACWTLESREFPIKPGWHLRHSQTAEEGRGELQ